MNPGAAGERCRAPSRGPAPVGSSESGSATRAAEPGCVPVLAAAPAVSTAVERARAPGRRQLDGEGARHDHEGGFPVAVLQSSFPVLRGLRFSALPAGIRRTCHLCRCSTSAWVRPTRSPRWLRAHPPAPARERRAVVVAAGGGAAGAGGGGAVAARGGGGRRGAA